MIQKQIIVNSFHEDELAESLKLLSEDTTILVDFDETLFLYNSTAEYLNNLKPRLLGAILLKAIAFFKPWQWLVKSPFQKQSRDWFLVFLTTLLMPWNLYLWSIKAKKLAKEQSNYELIEQLNSSPSNNIIVASLGFNFIIWPILNAMPIKSQKLIGCRFWQGLKDRQKGKLVMVKESITTTQLSSSMVITDSLDDLSLLTKVAKPFLVVWDESRYNPPMKDLYFPMMYLNKVKRVGENYIVKSILFDDLPILLLAFSWFTNRPLLHSCGILILLFSFWCIYEYGYYENDLVAEKYEQKPILSNSYYSSQVKMNWWQPWIWSSVLAAMGVFVLAYSQSVATLNIISLKENFSEIAVYSLFLSSAWAGFLLLSRLSFFIYNYVNKKTRIWFYFILQTCRYCGFMAIATTNLIGISILLAQILARGISYTVYRYAGGSKVNWPKLQEKFLRCLLFALFIISITIVESDLSLLINWQTFTISLWCLFRGGQHIKQIFETVGLIQKEKTNKIDELVAG